MPTIPGSFAALLDGFRGCFTAPTFTTFTRVPQLIGVLGYGWR
jgi:hypothetical protein